MYTQSILPVVGLVSFTSGCSCTLLAGTSDGIHPSLDHPASSARYQTLGLGDDLHVYGPSHFTSDESHTPKRLRRSCDRSEKCGCGKASPDCLVEHSAKPVDRPCRLRCQVQSMYGLLRLRLVVSSSSTAAIQATQVRVSAIPSSAQALEVGQILDRRDHAIWAKTSPGSGVSRPMLPWHVFPEVRRSRMVDALLDPLCNYPQTRRFDDGVLQIRHFYLSNNTTPGINLHVLTSQSQPQLEPLRLRNADCASIAQRITAYLSRPRIFYAVYRSQHTALDPFMLAAGLSDNCHFAILD